MKASVANALQSKYGVQQATSQTIAHLANGNFIKALETIHLNEENELFFKLFVSLMRLSYQRKIREMKQYGVNNWRLWDANAKRISGILPTNDPGNFIYNLHRKELTT